MQAQFKITGIQLDEHGEPLVMMVTHPSSIGMRAVKMGEHCACGIGHKVHADGEICQAVITATEGGEQVVRTCICTVNKPMPIYQLEQLSVIAPGSHMLNGIPRIH